MGHGPARELAGPEGPLPELDEAISQRLGEALAKLDAKDPDFQANRQEEKDAQMSKLWGRTCKQIDEQLRLVAKVLIASHQVGLDNGSVGGGRSTKPWIEETRGKLGRLYFQLNGEEVQAVCSDKLLGRGTIEESKTYEWLEKMVVKWVILAAEGQIPIE